MTGLVMRREIRERLREKAFAVSTAVNIVIIVAVVIIASLVSGDDESYTVGWSTESERVVVQAAADAGRAVGVTIEVSQIGSPGPPADVALEGGSLDAVVTKRQIRFKEEPEAELVSLLQSANREVRALEALERAGVSGEEARRALEPPPLRVSALEPADDDGKAGVAFFAILILYGQLLTYGYWVAAGVVEEKASRVVEVLLATVKPRDLLAGKIIGLGLLGLAQLVLAGGVGLALAELSGAIDLDRTTLETLAVVLVWFVFGYALYACLYAMTGVLVSRQEDLQSASTPLTFAIVLAFVVAFPALEDPSGTIARVASIVPFTSPIVMPVRVALEDANAIEIAASLALLAGSVAALVPLGARIYEGAILRTGRPLKLAEAWRAARA